MNWSFKIFCLYSFTWNCMTNSSLALLITKILKLKQTSLNRLGKWILYNNNIYTLWGLPRPLLPVRYIFINLVNSFLIIFNSRSVYKFTLSWFTAFIYSLLFLLHSYNLLIKFTLQIYYLIEFELVSLPFSFKTSHSKNNCQIELLSLRMRHSLHCLAKTTTTTNNS